MALKLQGLKLVEDKAWVFWEVSWKENRQAMRKTWESIHLRDGQSQPLESQSDSEHGAVLHDEGNLCIKGLQ